MESEHLHLLIFFLLFLLRRFVCLLEYFPTHCIDPITVCVRISSAPLNINYPSKTHSPKFGARNSRQKQFSICKFIYLSCFTSMRFIRILCINLLHRKRVHLGCVIWARSRMAKKNQEEDDDKKIMHKMFVCNMQMSRYLLRQGMRVRYDKRSSEETRYGWCVAHNAQ